MFIITKTFTDDEGHLFTKVNPKQYSTPGEAYDAMREDYLNELKSRGLEDNGSSNDDGESCPGGYIISDEAQIYDFAQYTPYEQLLREDIRRYDIKPTVIRTKDEMHEFYRTQPDEMILAALVEVDDKATGKRYCSIRVWCSGHEIKTRSMGSYYVLNKHYLTVNKDDMVATYPYPFSCDDGANTLLEAKDTDILTPVERLFLWTEYKNPNPIETKKK